MASIVLMGAGASYGSGDAEPYPPPLGKGPEGLFAKLEELGGIAAALPDDLKALFRADFEAGMAEYFVRSDMAVLAFHREMAGYLAKFVPGEASVYRRLIKALGVQRVVYVTLNYDLLLELAGSHLGHRIANYGFGPNYTGFRVIKPHGSSHFWPDTQGNTLTGNISGASGADFVGPMQVLTQAETLARCASEPLLAPVISMYAEGKAVRVCPAAVTQQQEMWSAAVKAAGHVYVIGVAVHRVDEHIWRVLGEAKAAVTYFGLAGDKAAFLEWKEASSKRNAYFVQARFHESVNFIRRQVHGK